MKNETTNIAEVIKEYDELVEKSKGIDPSWKDEEVNALMSRISRTSGTGTCSANNSQMPELYKGNSKVH